MTLTVKEKQHWRDRISHQIDQAIDALSTASDPGFCERIHIAAHKRAVESLGIAEPQARLAAIRETRKALDSEEDMLIHTMAAKLKVDCHPTIAHLQHTAIENAIQARAAVYEKELLAADPLGVQILELRREQEDLLDTVWLATSGMQIKQLWTHVRDILHQQPTNLQTHALSLQPVRDENE